MQVSLGLHVGRRPITVGSVELLNYPDLPRSGLPGPRLLRSGSSERPKVSRDHERRVAPFERLLVSASELASDMDTEVPDSAGDFPSQAVRSVPLLHVGHSATTAGARFLSSFERAMLSRDDETASPFRTTFERRRRRGEHRTTPFDRQGSKRGGGAVYEPCGRCIPSLLRSFRSLRGGRGISALTAEANRW